MKCTSRIIALFLSVCITISLTGCGSTKYDMPYSADSRVSSFRLYQVAKSETAEPFAANFCVPDSVSDSNVNIEDTNIIGLFDLRNKELLYAENITQQVNPASLTKVMTALVALKNASPDMVLTATENCLIDESGAQVIGLKPGDSMTLDQALRIILIYSANDVANLIAEGVGGTIDNFISMMNDEALRLGATNTNFVNPHGLTTENHLVSAYDMYLIFNEALQYELFNEIIQMTSYTTAYYDAKGQEKPVEIKSTNLFLNETYSPPAGLTVIGGKTGTTNAAGHCLILYTKNTKGDPYISIVMKSQSTDELYQDMGQILSIIP